VQRNFSAGSGVARHQPDIACQKGTPMRCTTPALILAITAALALSACNTISGAGRDVSSVGKAVTRTANDVKN
jgi:entericidin B